ncbi:MAG TPA: protein-L-isoaspartate O-methyltransferase [Methanotrichaceae archaeon]|nr:protein-L-isoaspartate O-methyltransferase [Methanotrichaceae archaeon]
MQGWIIPPPKEPTKSREDFEKERTAKVGWLVEKGLLKSERIKQALLKVPREDFIPRLYRDYAYLEVPLPLPGERATISCPHSYPLFYEPLGLDKGHRFLEIGSGSGYGAAVAREVVGPDGLVVSVEIDPVTLEFARQNLEKVGYHDIVIVQGDGGLGYPKHSPYDSIAVTAACAEIPPPLIDQLRIGGRLIAPVLEGDRQNLTLIEKGIKGVQRRILGEVLYASLRGVYGFAV